MAGLKFTQRKSSLFLNVIHIIVGVSVAVLAAFAVVSPEKYNIFFPAIFFLAALLNLVNGWFQFKMYPRIRKKYLLGVIYIITGVILLALFVVSAVSLWGKQ